MTALTLRHIERTRSPAEATPSLQADESIGSVIGRATNAAAPPRAAELHQVFWIGDTHWTLCSPIRESLFDSDGLRLKEWQRSGQATLVKSAAGRTIHRVQLPELEFYVKHFRNASVLDRMHQLLRASRAEKEYRLAHLLRDRGIPTVSPLALGERRRRGLLFDAYLLTEAIPAGTTLFDLIERHYTGNWMSMPASLRFHFAEQLAQLAASIHEHNIEHGDLHERNIVVQPQGVDLYRFHLLDLHELQIHRRLGWERAQRELSRMGRYFTLRTSTADRLRFFRRYAELRGMNALDLGVLAREVERTTIASRADFWRRRDVKSPHKSPRIREYSVPGMKAFALRSIPAAVVTELMRNPEQPFQDHVVRWWKVGRRTRVAEVRLPGLESSDPVIYKQYFFKGWHESLAALFRQNQSSRAWKRGGSLLLRDLPTPKPLALIHQMRFGLPVTSYLITERVPDSETIVHYVDRVLPGLDTVERRRTIRGLLHQAARLLRMLHDRQATHRDLKASNVLVSRSHDSARPTLWLIDLDGVYTWHKVPLKQRVQNLTRFYVNFHRSPWLTRTDLLRFLRLYLARGFRDRDHWKRLWRLIEQQTKKKLLRNLRKGRTAA